MATATVASSISIDISMPYTDDENGNNTYTVEYKESSSGTTEVNTGDKTNAPSDDILSNTRPVNGTNDIGGIQ